MLNNEINKSLLVVDGWRRGIIRIIFPQQAYKEEHPRELQPIPPKSQSSSDNVAVRAQNSSHDLHANRRQPFSGCVTKVTNPNTKERKTSPSMNEQDSLNLPRIQSPPKLDSDESYPTEGNDDIETIACDYLTVAEMLNPDLISRMPENNWI